MIQKWSNQNTKRVDLLDRAAKKAPVIEDPRLPKMDENSNRPRRIRGKIVRMPPNPSPSRGGKKLMDPVSLNKEENQVTFEKY